MNKPMDIQFEAWARKMSMDLEYRNIPGAGQFYECPRTLLALEAWQASRAAIEVVLPSDARMYFNGAPDEAYTDGIQCWYGGVSAAKQSIESLGLRVKP